MYGALGRGSTPPLPPPQDDAEARPRVTVEVVEVLGSDEEVNSSRVRRDAALQAEVPPVVDPRRARACAPLLVPFVEANSEFATQTVPLHQAYLGPRSTELVLEFGMSDRAELNLAIESAASQVSALDVSEQAPSFLISLSYLRACSRGQMVVLAQGYLVSFSMEWGHHEREVARLHMRAEAPEEATPELRAEREALSTKAAKLSGQAAKVDRLRMLEVEVSGLWAQATEI
ncbi:hypothetical protein GUJ93_ZPchr0006g42100 [Zizania palustris]|uniref:Uncharacterized protein n=1 Tax=Zizania palustris TaxID=103762 RepID=A0A8J5T5R9_ZIZPA|nr:hypothetical protein GUJ93_ZPchr0006g42100 [Zizania palustris]